MFFSTLSSYLFILEPAGKPFIVYGLLGKSSGRLSLGNYLRFWKLDLDNSKGYLGGQRDAYSLKQQHIEFILLGADIA